MSHLALTPNLLLTINTFYILTASSLNLLLTVSLSALLGTSAMGAEEKIVNGDFSTFDSWEPAQMPSTVGREIIEQNSPFTKVYPSNGKSVKLTDSPDQTFCVFLKQSFPAATGKIVWSFDYLRPNIDEELTDPGFGIRLSSGKKNHTQVRIGADVIVNLSTGERGMSSAEVKSTLLERGVWYHFQCEIDLAAQTLHGTLTSEENSEFEIPEIQLAPSKGADPAVIDGIEISSAAGAAPSVAQPIILDNLSIQQLP